MKPVLNLVFLPDCEVVTSFPNDGGLILIVNNIYEGEPAYYNESYESEYFHDYHVYRLCGDKVFELDYFEAQSLYKDLPKYYRVRLWRSMKHLRPWKTYDQLRPRLYERKRQVLYTIPHSSTILSLRSKKFLDSHAFEYDPLSDHNGVNKDLRRLENLYIRSTYGNLLKGSKSEGK